MQFSKHENTITCSQISFKGSLLLGATAYLQVSGSRVVERDLHIKEMGFKGISPKHYLQSICTIKVVCENAPCVDSLPAPLPSFPYTCKKEKIFSTCLLSYKVWAA